MFVPLQTTNTDRPTPIPPMERPTCPDGSGFGTTLSPIPDAWRETLPSIAVQALQHFVQTGEYAAIEPWFDLRIGFEVHLRLATGRKLFCDAAADQAGYVDMGLPGSYPVLDPQAVRLARRLGRALGADLPPRMAFERKRYAYPDLTKGYQTTQKGLCAFHGGQLDLPGIGLMTFERGQIEEDAASVRRLASHIEIETSRAGSPLVELVSKPMRLDPSLAGTAVKMVRDLAVHLGVSGGAPEKAEFKTDVCVSLAPLGQPWGERIEIKGVALFESVERSAIACARRLAELLLAGAMPQACTWRYDEDTDALSHMRAKQDSLYRFLPDGDLGLVTVPEVDLLEKQWDALPPPEFWRQRSTLTKGPLIDDPAIESLCWWVATLAGWTDLLMPSRPPAPAEPGTLERQARIEKIIMSAFTRWRIVTPRDPIGRVVLARALAWCLTGPAAQAALRLSLDAAQHGMTEDAFNADVSDAAWHRSSSLQASSEDVLKEQLIAWLSTGEPLAAWDGFLAGQSKTLGRLIGLAKRVWPSEDPQHLGHVLRSLAQSMGIPS